MTNTITFAVEASEAVAELNALAVALDGVTAAANRLHTALAQVAPVADDYDAKDVVQRTELLIRNMVKQELGCA